MLRVQDSVAQSQCSEQLISLLVTQEIWRLVQTQTVYVKNLKLKKNLENSLNIAKLLALFTFYPGCPRLQVERIPAGPSLSLLPLGDSIHVHHSTDTGRATHHPALPFFISFMIQPQQLSPVTTSSPGPRVLLMTNDNVPQVPMTTA